MTYSVLRDSLHLVMLPKFQEVGGDLLLIDQDHIANMVEPKLELQLLRLQNACSKGCFLNAFLMSACSHRQGLCVSICCHLQRLVPECP